MQRCIIYGVDHFSKQNSRSHDDCVAFRGLFFFLIHICKEFIHICKECTYPVNSNIEENYCFHLNNIVLHVNQQRFNGHRFENNYYYYSFFLESELPFLSVPVRVLNLDSRVIIGLSNARYITVAQQKGLKVLTIERYSVSAGLK